MLQALTLSNHLSELERLEHWVQGLGRELELTSAQVFHLNLALEEVVTNVIKYAFPPGVSAPIHLRCRVQPERLTVEVIDGGREFNPLSAPMPAIAAPLEERPIGGVGIYLAEKVMDELSYARQGESNVLTMVMRRGGETGR